MNLSPSQKFTGYWIPVELSKLGLTKIEQFLLAMIDSLDSGDPDYCFESNAYLANQMELSESRISFYITKFKRMKLIEEVSFSGRVRRLKSLQNIKGKHMSNIQAFSIENAIKHGSECAVLIEVLKSKHRVSFSLEDCEKVLISKGEQ